MDEIGAFTISLSANWEGHKGSMSIDLNRVCCEIRNLMFGIKLSRSKKREIDFVDEIRSKNLEKSLGQENV